MATSIAADHPGEMTWFEDRIAELKAEVRSNVKAQAQLINNQSAELEAARSSVSDVLAKARELRAALKGEGRWLGTPSSPPTSP